MREREFKFNTLIRKQTVINLKSCYCTNQSINPQASLTIFSIMTLEQENVPHNSTAGHPSVSELVKQEHLNSASANSNNNNLQLKGPVGCYLVYESSSGGRLVLQYSQGHVPANAVGFYGGGKPIASWKFQQHHGRSDLIKGIAGGDSNRRKYFVGWCQFLKLAKQNGAKAIAFVVHGQGVAVDVYGYKQAQNQPELLPLERGMTDLSNYDGIAVMPKHHEFLKGVKSIAVSNFLELGNLAGATTTLA
jgi:hypothetical protein